MTGKFQLPYKLNMALILIAGVLALFGGGTVYLIICSTYRIDGQTYQEAIEELKKIDMGTFFSF